MKAVTLYSGGLDSSLVLEFTKDLGAQVFPLHISHAFLSLKGLPEIPGLKIIDTSKEMVNIIRNPQFGYGKNLNPCIDCRIMMLKKAKEYMAEVGADFIVTGEVLDQRPMSQRLENLMLIDKEAGLEGLVVRPLSGGLLPPTIPEKKGFIDGDKLLKIKGRSRKVSLELAEAKKMNDFFSPSGGCLLTDPGFCRRLADLMRFQEKIGIGDIELLKIGRHFRLAPETKLVVGRNEEENTKIEEMASSTNILLHVPDTGSPNAILIGNKKYLKTSAAITARYSDKKEEVQVEVTYDFQGETNKMPIKPMDQAELAKWRI
jgi:tRNA-specific 2-thiouridylase